MISPLWPVRSHPVEELKICVKMKTTWICYGLVLNSLFLFVALLNDLWESILPVLFFAMEIILIVLFFRNLFSERNTEWGK